MTRDERIALVRAYFDAVNSGSIDTAVGLLDPAFVQHTAGLPPGPQSVKWSLAMFLGGFPDFHLDIDFILADADRVIARVRATGTHKGTFLGHAPTEKVFNTTGIDVFRVDAGKIRERWTEFDTFGMLKQLGIV
jgi:steroid delta-isomerase-like uncharacterized protein